MKKLPSNWTMQTMCPSVARTEPKLKIWFICFRKQLVDYQTRQATIEEKMADVVEQNAENKDQVNYLMNKQKKCAHQKEVLQGRLVQFEQEGKIQFIIFS